MSRFYNSFLSLFVDSLPMLVDDLKKVKIPQLFNIGIFIPFFLAVSMASS